MRNTQEQNLENQLHNIEYATIFNFQPWLKKTADTLDGTLQWPTKLFYSLLKKGKIKAVPVYPVESKLWRYNTFYCPTDSKVQPIGSRMVMHQSGLRDILLAFTFLYPQYDVQIKHEPCYKKNVGGKTFTYRPDALVTMIKKDATKKRYDFIVEFERTKEPLDIKKNKLDKLEAFGSFKQFGLSDHVKILIVFTYHKYNVYWRPIEYSNPTIQAEISAVQNRMDTLLSYARRYDRNKYRFLPFNDFYRLNEYVWYKPGGEKTGLLQGEATLV